MNRLTDWHIATPVDAPGLPWRNGGGVTHEFAAWPSGADWTWRVSVAEVGRAGPFSKFPDTDRWFTVLKGEGVQLALASHTLRIRSDDAPFLFDGNADCACTPIDGETLALNFMVRRNQAASRMRRVRGTLTQDLGAAAFAGVYVIDSSAHLQTDDSAITLLPGQFGWRLFNAAGCLRVASDNALCMEVFP